MIQQHGLCEKVVQRYNLHGNFSEGFFTRQALTIKKRAALQ
jgi:hypothetical protein